eukprot:TRINITY_DN1296_c0_g1_i1.p1 TRINITY_DN1296_c0_g1~~TRINITY_DN1296_c0_g1_i1.p1  ORF type:complete len:247 (-),score=38.01 TRINITY_DN1296_c0_g1_i1:952-1692(-)
MVRAQLFVITVLIATVHFAAGSGKCFIELTRIFGTASRNRYALLCKCSPTVAKSLVFSAVRAEQEDTVGRGAATVRCIAHQRRRLTTQCNYLNSTEFARHAHPVLNRCFNRTALTPQEASATEPFTFVSDNCVSKFASSQGSLETAAAWVCECAQNDFYEVTPGWPRYVLSGSAAAKARGLDEIRSCAMPYSQQMQQVCTNSAGDYDVLGLHILQTCCKRARTQLESKFECAAIVPDDLTDAKFEL